MHPFEREVSEHVTNLRDRAAMETDRGNNRVAALDLMGAAENSWILHWFWGAEKRAHRAGGGLA